MKNRRRFELLLLVALLSALALFTSRRPDQVSVKPGGDFELAAMAGACQALDVEDGLLYAPPRVIAVNGVTLGMSRTQVEAQWGKLQGERTLGLDRTWLRPINEPDHFTNGGKNAIMSEHDVVVVVTGSSLSLHGRTVLSVGDPQSKIATALRDCTRDGDGGRFCADGVVDYANFLYLGAPIKIGTVNTGDLHRSGYYEAERANPDSSWFEVHDIILKTALEP